jgi:transposase
MNHSTIEIARFLSIDPSIVENVDEIDVGELGKEAIITITLVKKVPSIPKGMELNSVHLKEYRIRTFSHAYFIDKKCVFRIKLRIYRGKGKDGKTHSFAEPNPFCSKRSRVSHETESQVISSLMDYSSTFVSVGKRLHLSNTAVIDIFDRVISFKRRRLPRVLCIDECYGDGCFDEPYCLVMLDFDRMKIVDVLKGRDKLTISNYLGAISQEERANVEYVSIDMWDPYRDLASRYFPNAKICVDSFHVVENMARALDGVRCRIMRGYVTGSDEYYLLKQWKWLLFTEPEKVNYSKKIYIQKIRGYRSHGEMLQSLLNINIELKEAYFYYLSYRKFNAECQDEPSAEASFMKYAGNPIVGRTPEFAAIELMLQNWRQEIVNSFNRKFVGPDGWDESKRNARRISNGPIEGENSQFKKLLCVSNGLANFARFRNRLMLCYNKELAFSPKQPSKLPTKTPGKKRGHYRKKKAGISAEKPA